ncbi:MAG: Crp/Fnr family transcriptional regulator, partial [Bacteroidales bacterium]
EELKAPETIASAFIFGDKNELPVNVSASEDTKVLVIPRQELLKILKNNEVVLHNYLNIISNRAQQLSGKIRLLGMQTIKGKLACYLLNLSKDRTNEKIILPNTQEEIAGMFGVARPSVARVLRKMGEEGLIRASGKHIRILDRMGLSDLLR